ncbi:hypothetical protein [Streptomyces paludis]|uniref:hypothetical protein n=1 Tax=Streptomyces paludis TaxID=2282738 RepID=UPI0015F2BA66|nr:hypothetical protein [Streptomyces paludis]
MRTCGGDGSGDGNGSDGSDSGSDGGGGDGHVGDDDRCAVCDRPGADACRWSLLSCHTTSAGVVEYCGCRCGTVAVLIDGRIDKVLGRRGAHWAPDRTGEESVEAPLRG